MHVASDYIGGDVLLILCVMICVFLCYHGYTIGYMYSLAPEWVWKWGHRSGKMLSCPSTCFGFTNTISRFGERFRVGQYSLVSFLFAVLILTVPPCPAICKSGNTCPPCPVESAPVNVLCIERVTQPIRDSMSPIAYCLARHSDVAVLWVVLSDTKTEVSPKQIWSNLAVWAILKEQ